MSLLPVLVMLALASQSAPAAPPAAAAANEALVRTWFDRWNQLDGSQASVDAWIALYESDALHTAGPASHQKGTVTFKGHEGLKALAAMTVATTERPAYRLEIETAHEQSAVLFHTAAGPWGGPSVGVQFAAVSTDKATGKRDGTPGAAFFQVEAGKIRRLRLYLAADERAEVEPQAKRRPPQ